MASKVNTKFLVMLSAAAIAAVLLVVGLTYFMHFKAPERMEKQGDQMAQKEQWNEAANFYKKAFGRDTTNVRVLTKWRDALTHIVPTSQADYDTQFNMTYMGVLRKMAELLPADPAPALELISKRVEVGDLANSASYWESVATEATEMLRELPAGDKQTDQVVGMRGLAGVGRMQLIDVPADAAEQVLKDVRQGLAADPQDHRFAMGVVEWHLARYNQARREQANDRIGPAREALTAEINAFNEKFPARVEARTLDLRVQFEELRASTEPVERKQVRVEALRQATRDLVAFAQNSTAKDLDANSFGSLSVTATGLVGQEALPPLRGIADRLLAEDPADADVLTIAAQLASDAADLDAAEAMYGKIVALPDLPLSIRGMKLNDRRTGAEARLVDLSLARFSSATDQAQKDASLAKAKEYRARLAARFGKDGSPLIAVRDAKIALAENRVDQAAGILSQLRSSNPQGIDMNEVLVLHAQSLMAQNNIGAARDALEQYLAAGRQPPSVLAALGEIYIRMGDHARAAAYLQRAVELEPTNQNAQRLLEVALAQLSPDAADSSDPVVAHMIRAQQLSTTADLAALDAHLERGLELYPDDERVVQTTIEYYLGVRRDFAKARAIAEAAMKRAPDDVRLVELRTSALIEEASRDQDMDRAARVVDEALAQYPDNATLKRLKIAVSERDPMARELALIATSTADDFEKELSRASTYRKYGKTEDSLACLRNARTLRPDDRRPVESLFAEALDAKRWDEAQALATEGAQKNFDQVNGLLYQAQLQMAQGKDRDAVTTLVQATQRVRENPRAQMLLGRAQFRTGNVADGLRAYQTAFQINPTDPAIAAEYAASLESVGRGADALAVLSPKTGAMRANPGNLQLRLAWLEFESRYGDRALAVSERRALFAVAPDLTGNSAALARLLIEDKAFEEAETVLATLDQKGRDPAAAAALRARVRAEQGDVEGGLSVLRTFADAQDAGAPKMAALALAAQFLVEQDRLDDALKVLDEARAHQDNQKREADRSAGDYLFGAQRFGEAAAAYEPVVAGAGAKDPILLKRLADTYLRTDPPRLDDAQKLLDRCEAEGVTDVEILLLRSDLFRRRQDMRNARLLADQAVERYPSDVRAFLHRAAINMDDSARQTDVLADLDQVVKLQPANTDAWQARFAVFKRQDKPELAIASLRDAIVANPALDELKLMLLRELISGGRANEAQAEVRRFADDRKQDSIWQLRAGQILRDGNRWTDALVFYRRAHDLSPNAETRAALLDALLRQPTAPDRTEVIQLTDKVAADGREGAAYLLVRARACMFLDRRDEAYELALAAYEQVKGAPGDAIEWLEQMGLMLGGPNEAAKYVLAMNPEGGLPVILQILTASYRVASGTSMDDVLKSLEIDEAGLEPPVKLALHRARGQLLYQSDRDEQAVAEYRKAVELAPKDAEINNNLAYILSNDLGDPSSALPYAKTAIEVEPLSSAAQDTLGWVYFKLGDFEKARQTLEQALVLATSDPDKIVAMAHLGRTKLKQNDRTGAQELLAQAQGLLQRTSPGIKAQLTPEVDSLAKELQ